MSGFLAYKERDQEALSCVIIFLLSSLFIVVFYVNVDDHGEFQENLERGSTVIQDPSILEQEIIDWR